MIKLFLETDETLKFITDSFKNWNVCNKDVDTYPFAIQFVPEYHKTEERCNKDVDTCPLVILFVISTTQ